MFPGGKGPARGSPALAVHNGELWCLWLDKNDGLLYHATSDNQSWGPKTAFVGNYWTGLVPDNPTAGPALADCNGVLHAAYSVDGSLVHYQYDDIAKKWGKRSLFARSSATPSLQAFDGRLFCAFQGDGNSLNWTTWDPEDGWMRPMSANEKTWGSPALYLLLDRLCLLFAENNDDRHTTNTTFNTSTKSWSRTFGSPSQKTAYGVSATGFNKDIALMAFQSHDDNDKGLVLVDTFNNGAWQHNESIGSSSSDTPAIAILNNVITVVYNAHTDARDLLWSQATLTDYTPDSWMTALANIKPNLRITDITIPGTHDTCAISAVPWVATQNMTVIAQLNAGIRYFDLRCRLVDGFLMMYHGDYALDMYLEHVLDDIYSWLRSHPAEGLIIQLSNEILHETDFAAFSLAATTLIVHGPNKDLWNTGVDQAKQQIGINATLWTENYNSPRFTIPTQDGTLVIQDQSSFSGAPDAIIPQKFGVVATLMDQASADESHLNLYINYTSMTSTFPFRRGPVAPWQLAIGYEDIWCEFTPGVNRHLRQKLVVGGSAHYGVVVMDFPELPQYDMIDYLITSNFEAAAV
ncbi:PLC-like phosphodiesterase [Lentinula edodes]|uniref:PLC-like phosphodiesterase n=1 Tax=Lentinula edodes TaxID=5353 RepID=A0A1Q3ELN8_LENED|nr:PLC-like phosphodiesterase [Lentinula edodes]